MRLMFLVSLVLLRIMSISAQDIEEDISIKKKDTLSYYANFHDTNFGEKKLISIRLGAGLQPSFYTELGAALHSCRYGDTGYFSTAYYAAVTWVPDEMDDVYGLKVGYEVSAFLLTLGLEMKYQTDFETNDFVITPKIGLGVFGDVNIFYGYNISTNNTPIYN